MPADRSEGRGRPARVLALLTGLAIAAAPSSASAFAPPSAEPSPSPEPSSEASEPDQAEAGVEGPAQPDAPDPSDAGDEVEVEVEGEEPRGGGMIGSVVDANDPNATRAQSDLEGEALDPNAAGVPDRLPKLQVAGWWLVFGGVTLAAGGGVLAGIAETREDDANRLAYGFSLTTGTASRYSSVADEWEQTLREGEAFQAAARGLVIAGAVVLVGGIGFFIADAVQRKRGRAERSARRAAPIEFGRSGALLSF